ncbi:MAG: SIS domain-containing protein [Coprobacillus cateniformis]
MNFIYQNISSKICVIVLSVSGETEEIIEYLQHFKRTNSSIICITNSTKSTIAKLSDVCIPYYITEESFEGSNITSQVLLSIQLNIWQDKFIVLSFIQQRVRNKMRMNKMYIWKNDI